jgi:hypothetical protein
MKVDLERLRWEQSNDGSSLRDVLRQRTTDDCMWVVHWR